MIGIHFLIILIAATARLIKVKNLKHHKTIQPQCHAQAECAKVQSYGPITMNLIAATAQQLINTDSFDIEYQYSCAVAAIKLLKTVLGFHPVVM